MTVRLAAPAVDQPVRVPVDVVAAFDVSMSNTFAGREMLKLEKAALELVIEQLRPGDRLAVVPFYDEVATDVDAKEMQQLVAMSDQGKQKIGGLVKARMYEPGRGNRFSKALDKAEKILMERTDVSRAAFIVLLSDGRDDDSILSDKEWSRVSALKEPKYPAHTFGFLKHKADTLRHIAGKTNGTYLTDVIATSDDIPKLVAAFGGLVSRPFSAVGARVDLVSAHPGVSISKIESGEKKASIGKDARSGSVYVGAINAGETTEFTVLLDVPEGDADADVMEVLAVDGAYTQGWDGKPGKLGRSVVSVDKPAPPPAPQPEPPQDPCKELDRIEERLEYWCKVKLELCAKYEEVEAEACAGSKCQCHFTAALREAALESINRAMHHDIYTAVVQAIKLRGCGTGKTAVEHQDGGDKETANGTTENK